MNEDRITINFGNKENHKIVFFYHQVFADRKFNNNKIEETFWFNLTKEEMKELAKKLDAAAGV